MTSYNGRPDQKALYRQLMAGLYDAMLVTDSNGHLIEMNPRAKEYFLYRQEEVWDKPVSMLIPGITANMISRIRRGLDESRHIMLDAPCQRQDGSSFAAEITISVIDLINAGDLVFTVRNTERRRRQWQTLRSKANAYENALSACFVCDENGLFRAVNLAFLTMFDLSSEEVVLGRPFSDLMPDEPLTDLFARALAGERVNYRLDAETDSRNVAEVEVQMAPDVQGKDKIMGVVGSVLRV